MKFDVRSYAETGSTNDDAAALLGTSQGAGAVLLADYQRAGRGRLAREWVAPAGSSLLFTTLLPEAIPSDALWAVTFWTALGVADGIEAATGLRVELQWPNDLLLDGRKCCGILCISRVAGDRAWVGCGTGVNVIRPKHDSALDAVVPSPAFLSDGSPGVERTVVLEAILAAYERRISTLTLPHAIAREWETRAKLYGTPYRLLIDGTTQPVAGIAQRLDGDGSLIVTSDGAERRITLADARVLRT